LRRRKQHHPLRERTSSKRSARRPTGPTRSSPTRAAPRGSWPAAPRSSHRWVSSRVRRSSSAAWWRTCT
jgi:hypothetical protein